MLQNKKIEDLCINDPHVRKAKRGIASLLFPSPRPIFHDFEPGSKPGLKHHVPQPRREALSGVFRIFKTDALSKDAGSHRTGAQSQLLQTILCHN